MASGPEFAVIDVETTGFGKTDRLIEIAAIRLDANGNQVSQFVTLINPCRDVGPTRKHGISASDVAEAPRFEEVIGDLVSCMSNAIVVAHHAAFDLKMLRQEFVRSQYAAPEFPFLCTLQLARRLLPALPKHTLDYLCKALGITSGVAHSAEADARATASLLFRLLSETNAPMSEVPEICTALQAQSPATWSHVAASGRSTKRAANKPPRLDVSRITRILESLPTIGDGSAETTQYADLLDRVLEDRKVTREEAIDLYELASTLGLARCRVAAIHAEYFKTIARASVAAFESVDSVRRDLEVVAELLGIPDWMANDLISSISCNASIQQSPVQNGTAERLSLAESSVCFTGEFRRTSNGEPMTRRQIESIATSHGLVVHQRVTKKLNLLVVSDPETMSTKAKKAREYGVRILVEPAFWKLIGVDSL